MGGHGCHIIFVLDMSGSMSRQWGGVVSAYKQYVARRRQNQNESDLVSIVQFDSSATTSARQVSIGNVPNDLTFRGGGTQFGPSAKMALEIGSESPVSHVPSVIFMSDGMAGDAPYATNAFTQLSNKVRRVHNCYLELHVIAFGGGASTSQLQSIASSSPNGKLHLSADTAELSNIFVDIASGGSLIDRIQSEIGKCISEAVSDKISAEYFA